MSLGITLKQLREQQNLTQIELAKTLKLADSTISLYESDKREPDYETLKKIADFFSVTVDYLLGREMTIKAYKVTGDVLDISELEEEEQQYLRQLAEMFKKKMKKSKK
jgi:transcriptional regulator with XRE-family HTH domain